MLLIFSATYVLFFVLFGCFQVVSWIYLEEHAVYMFLDLKNG